MDRKKKVLVVCGTGIATSTMVHSKLEALFKKNGIQADIRRAMTSEAKYASKDADLIIATTQVPDAKCPVLSGIPYITGMGVPKLEEEILAFLKNLP